MKHMRLLRTSWIAAAMLTMAALTMSSAAPITAVVNFDPPGTPQGPSIYIAVPGPQTLTTVPATFSGGVALGFATFFPAIAFATPPCAPSGWDFLIDTVAFNQSVTTVVNAPPPPVVQPPTPPVQGHRHGHHKGEVEPVEVNFGDDVNDIRGSVLVVTPTTMTPEP